MKNAWIGLVASAMALGLTACSSKPSNEDAQQAVAALVEQSGAGRVVDVGNLEISGCGAVEGSESYRCDVHGRLTLEVSGRQATIPINRPLRFAKADGTWRASFQ